MKLIVTSSEDPASMSIRGKLLQMREWREEGRFGDHPALRADDFMMILADRIHLEEDHIDGRASAALEEMFSTTIFASRHSSESRIPTLTVHPVGNYSTAEFGGTEGILSPSSPRFMTTALRHLATNSRGLEFGVSFETTHHGPLTDGPAFYIEIGSCEEFWTRDDAALAVAKTILSAEEANHPTVICIGGGHYAPRFTELALSRGVAIGHMAANYALDALDEGMLLQMSEKSGGAERVYFHRKSMPKAKYRELRERCGSLGMEETRSEDFAEL